jgi:hypothetical protein
LALAGSFELLMTLIRARTVTSPMPAPEAHVSHPLPIPDRDAPPALASAPDVVQTVRAWHDAGHSQRAIARELGVDRRKVRRIIDHRT